VRPLIFTHYKSLWDKAGVPETASWARWLEFFASHVVKGSDGTDEAALNKAKDGPCIVLGEIPAGEGHKNDNVVAMHALGLDLDDLDDPGLEAVAATLSPYEWAMYTTHKHGSAVAAGKIKVRVILPLHAPYPRARHKIVWGALQNLVGGKNDPATKNPARVFYLPTTYDLSVAWAFRNEGAWIDADALVTQHGAPKDKRPIVESARELFRLLDQGRPGEHLKAATRAVTLGQPFAEKGERHAAILDLTLWMAEKSEDAPFTDEAIEEVFASSCAAFALRDGDAPTAAEISTAYRGALEKRREWAEERRVERVEQAYSAQLRGGDKYTDADLDRIATAAEVPHDPGASAQALAKRWIVHAGDQVYYVLAPDGGYRGPYGASLGRTAAVELLARSPVLLNEPGPRGTRRRGMQELAEDFGTAAAKVVVDLTRHASIFDEKRRVLYEAACPVREDLAPSFDAEIDAWLRVFAGPSYEKLCDWMACAPDLGKLLCALYLSGGPAAGKTIFAMGIAQLWADAPAKFDDAMSGAFNEELLRCPLVLADEDFGQARWRKQDVTGQIRSMISTLERTVTRKYLPPAAMRGAIRLVIAANNDYLLSSKEALSGQDLEAIAQRFLYLRAPEASADHMAGVPGETKERWKREGIARHALWLQKNRVVTRGRRFWVEGDVTQMHRLMTISSDWTSRACEWLVRFLMNPKPYAQRADGLVRVGKGKLFVNEQAIIDGWALYFGERTRVEPETAKIGAALRAIAKPERPCLRWKGERRRYRDIIVDTLFAWSDAHGIGDRERMMRTLWDGEEAPRVPGQDDDDANDKSTEDMPEVPAINAAEEPF